jgi:transposase
MALFFKNVDKVTVIFDKGNNTKASMVLLDDTPYHFVGSLKPYDYKHFLEKSLEKFQLVPMENGEEDKKKDDIYAYRMREEVLGAERTVVVTYEQKLYNGNLKTFIKGIDKRKNEFEEFVSKIGRRRYRTKSAIEKKAEEKIQAKAPEGLFDVEVAEKEGNITFDYAVNKISVIKIYDVDKGLCLLNLTNEEQKAMFCLLDLLRYKYLVRMKLR